MPDRNMEHSGRSADLLATPDQPSISRLLFYGGCLTLPVLNLRIVGGNVTFSDLLFAASAIALIIFRSNHDRRPLYAQQVALFLILLGGAAAAFRADDATGHWLNIARLVFVVSLWPWIARTVLRTRVQVRNAILFWLVGSAAFAFVSIFQATTASASYESGRIPGLAQHVTDAGGILSIFSVTMMAALAANHRPIYRCMILAGLCFGIAGLILSGSVSGLIVVAIGALLVLLSFRSARKPILVLAGSLVAVIAYFATSSIQRSAGLGISLGSRLASTTSGRYDTLDQRLQTDLFAWQQVLSNPIIGRGMDTSSGQTVFGLQTHNLFLLSWFQGGILVFVALLLFVWAAASSPDRDPSADLWQRVMRISFAAAMAFAMTSPLLAQRYLWFPAVILLTMRYARSNEVDLPIRTVTTSQAPDDAKLKKSQNIHDATS